MKNPRIRGIVLFASLLLPIISTAQIEVHDNGKVSMGGNTASRPSCETYVYGSSGGGYALYVQHNNPNAWTCAIDANVLYDQCTSYGLDVNGGNVYYVSGQGWIYCGGAYINSDTSLKTRIIRLFNPMSKINRLSGYTYHYKKTVLDSGPEKGETFHPDSFIHAGVMAQEVQKVAPYMVKTVKNGKLAVDYLQLIPLLLEGEKQLDSERNALTDQLNLLQARFNTLASNLDTSGGNYKLVSNDNVQNSTSSFILYQNSPNPFTSQTTIEYALKGSYTAAYIYIFDLQGTLKKTSLLNGSGSLTIKGSDLYPGMFLYSLVVDGKQIDTKRMI